MFSQKNINREAILNNLCNLLDTIDTEAMLSLGIFYFTLLSRQQKETGLIKIEILAKYSIPRFGNNIGLIPNPEQIELCDNLLESCYKIEMFNGVENLFSQLAKEMQMGSNIIRGSAYPNDKIRIIKGIQGKFDKWFEKNVGISPIKAIEIILDISKSMVDNINNKVTELKNLHNFNQKFFVELDQFIAEFLPMDLEFYSINVHEINSLKNLIGVSKNIFNMDYKIKYTPLYILNSGKVLISDIANSMDMIFDAFDNKANQDNNFYAKDYQLHKSKWLENEIYIQLKKIFPEDSIYKNLSYSTDGETDLIVYYGDIILIIEAKAKNFNPNLSKISSINNVFRNNIEDSYIQSLKAKEYILSVEEASFIEKISKKQLKIKRKNISKYYHICVSLHHLDGLATMLERLKELNTSKIFIENSYPISICLSDLISICKLDINSITFLHYIERRLDLLNLKNFNTKGDELDLIGAYLNNRLNFSDHENFDSIAVLCSDIFDELMMYENGYSKDKPNLSLNLPESIRKLLELIEKAECSLSDKRIIIFEILNLNNYEINLLANIIDNIKSHNIPYGRFTSKSFATNDITFTITFSTKENVTFMHEHEKKFQNFSFRKSICNKYKSKTKKSICFIFIQENDFFLGILVTEYNWIKDLEIEKLIDNEILYLSDIKKLPKRNEKCLCGSEKKFKKCCINKVNIQT